MSKHKIWLIEFLVWGLVIFSTIFVSLYVYNKNIREKHTYYVFFNDVDGLIKGSPVKIQGYQVGYVSNISIVNEDVFITFIITDKKLEMPENLSATIAFTGMGGSKSLELFVPPEGSKAKNYITTIEPRRLQDFYFYQNQIARNIVTMTTNFLEMFDAKNTELLKNFIKTPTMLNDIHDTLDVIQQSEATYINKRRENANKNRK
ncbi:MAG: MlaD family protein [Opitutales bacterium]